MSPNTPPRPDGSGQVSGGVTQPAIAGEEQRGAEPGGGAPGQAVDAARRGEEEAPDHRRHQRGDGGQAEELHGEVGKDRARIAHRIGDGVVGGMAEAGIGDVPGAEAGQREGDAREKPEPGQPAGLAAQEWPECRAPYRSAQAVLKPQNACRSP